MEKKEFRAGTDHHHVREAEVVLAQGSTAVEVVRKLGITEQTYSAGEESMEGCVLNRRRD